MPLQKKSEKKKKKKQNRRGPGFVKKQGKNIFNFTKINGATNKIREIEKEIKTLPQEYQAYVQHIEGSCVYRLIAMLESL